MTEKATKPTTELNACVQALRSLTSEKDDAFIEAYIAEGNRHMKELVGAASCNITLINGLEHAISAAEHILERRRADKQREEEVRAQLLAARGIKQ